METTHRQRLIRMGSVALLFWTILGTLHGDVLWRISVKVLLGSPSQRPGIIPVTDQEIQGQVDFANTNRFLAGRGIQLRLTEIREIPKQSSESRNWFGADFYDHKNEFEGEAKSNAAYLWRDDQINIYINHGTPGGLCSFPSILGNKIIAGGADTVAVVPEFFLHEIGHFMSVRHTHEGANCSSEKKEDCANCPNPKGGTLDLFADTLSDHHCFNQSGIATEAFGVSYFELNAKQQEEVDNTYFNIMSYHDIRSVLTTLQLDAMCDTSNQQRHEVVHGDFIFVDPQAITLPPSGISRTGLSRGPMLDLKSAIDKASAGDVLLLRPGGYTEDRVIRKAVTLRAVRRDMLVAGNASIRVK